MAEGGAGDDWLRLPAASGGEVAERIRDRVRQRIERGIVRPEDVERVRAARLAIFAPDDSLSEAFRRCCVAWEVDRPAPITSHRPGIGPAIVAAKRVVARLLRYQMEPFLVRQREFNRSLLLVLRELLRERDARGPR